jgi:hypothetical protein
LNSVRYGGAIANGGTLTITNSTFSGNIASSGDGIGNGGNTPALIRNTIVANNIRGCFGAITDGGHNLDDGISCGFSTANGSLSSTNPQLDPAGLQDNGGADANGSAVHGDGRARRVHRSQPRN